MIILIIIVWYSLLIFSLDLTSTRKLVVIKKQLNKQWLKQNYSKIQSTTLSVDNCELIIINFYYIILFNVTNS